MNTPGQNILTNQPPRRIIIDLDVGSNNQLHITQIMFQGVPGWIEAHRLLLNAVFRANQEAIKVERDAHRQAHPLQVVGQMPKELQG